MKKNLILIFLFVSTVTMAQKMKIVSGDFGFLAGQKDINVEFNYSNLKLLKENMPEEQYIAERTAELNEKTRGIGDTWKDKWEASKEAIWEAKFLDLMAKTVTAKENVLFKEGLDTKYTLVVDVVWIYPGWDAAVMKQPAKVSMDLRFVETANRNNVLAEITSRNAPGDQWGSNFSNESRIGEGFAKTAKSFGKLLLKKAY